MQHIYLYRSDDRSEFAFYQLENDRKCQAFRDKVTDIRPQHAALQSQIEKLAREQKNLLEVLERGGCIRPRKRPRVDGTGAEIDIKRRIRTHPARQLDCVRIAFAM